MDDIDTGIFRSSKFGQKCDCMCHRSKNYKHMAACCCPHRIRYNCEECKREDREAAERRREPQGN